MLTNDPMIHQLLVEAHARTITAVSRAIRDTFGNLPLPADSAEVFIDAEANRLGALLHHDLEMFLLRLKHGPDSISIVWPTLPTHDVYLDPANVYHCRDCMFSSDQQSIAEHHATQTIDKPRYEITGPIHPPIQGKTPLTKAERDQYLDRMSNWHGEPRRNDESISQFQRRVMREVEKG